MEPLSGTRTMGGLTATTIVSFSVCYRYWYQATCLHPDMSSVFIAIDKATAENGCLKVANQ